MSSNEIANYPQDQYNSNYANVFKTVNVQLALKQFKQIYNKINFLNNNEQFLLIRTWTNQRKKCTNRGVTDTIDPNLIKPRYLSIEHQFIFCCVSHDFIGHKIKQNNILFEYSGWTPRLENRSQQTWYCFRYSFFY